MVIAADSGEPRTSVWLTVRPAAPASRRSEAPSGLDRERITAAAVRLLDAEGLARFSMRRLAAGLGVTAMSLYWYVDTKHDLLELALDRVLGELAFTPGPAPDVLPAPDGPPGPGGWPGRLRALARAYHRILTEHPWVVPPTAAYPNIGPHAGPSMPPSSGCWAPPASRAPPGPAPTWPSRSSCTAAAAAAGAPSGRCPRTTSASRSTS